MQQSEVLSVFSGPLLYSFINFMLQIGGDNMPH